MFNKVVFILTSSGQYGIGRPFYFPLQSSYWQSAQHPQADVANPGTATPSVCLSQVCVMGGDDPQPVRA